MDWIWFQLEPRDARAAARTAAWSYLVAAMLIAASNVTLSVGGSTGGQLVALLAPIPLLMLALMLVRPTFPFKGILLIATPFLGVGAVVVLDYATHDASAGAQVALFLPVLFAASQLRFLGALLTAMAAVVGDVLIVIRLLPNAVGVLDVFDLGLVAFLMTGLLVVAGQRQDRFITALERHASLDPLTGLFTRRVLDEAVREAMRAVPSAPGTALILVDIDHFKSINDTYGHPIGDNALIHVSKQLAQRARPGTVISRLGGDEIAVLLPNCPEPVARIRAQEFLVAICDNPMALSNGAMLRISSSVGVAHCLNGKSTPEEVYAAADASLYDAKRAGRGRVGPVARWRPTAEPPPRIISDIIHFDWFEVPHPAYAPREAQNTSAGT